MAIMTEGRQTAEFILSEANAFRSRETVTVDATGGALEAGAVLGRVTASGKYVRHAAGATNGSEAEAGVLFAGIGAEEADRVIIARDAEVVQSALTYEDGADGAQITTSNTALAALGIIVR